MLNIPVSAIDPADTGFRITGPHRDISNLKASIASEGLLVPPLVIERKDGYAVISGFKRLEAVTVLGWDQITCRVLSQRQEDDSTLGVEYAAAMAAVSENAFTRQLSPAELIRSVALLECYMDHKTMARNSQVVFNAQMNSGYLKTLGKLYKISEKAIELLDTGQLSIKAGKALSKMNKAEIDGFLLLFSSIKASSGKQMEIITCTREICAREHIDFSQLFQELDAYLSSLETSDLPAAKSGHKDISARGNQVRAYLLQRRFPALALARKESAACLNRLKLGSGIRLNIPENFESMVYTMSLDFKSIQEFDARIHSVSSLADHPDFKGILDR